MTRFAFEAKCVTPTGKASSSSLFPLKRSGTSNDPNAKLPMPMLALDRKVRRFTFKECLKNSFAINVHLRFTDGLVKIINHRHHVHHRSTLHEIKFIVL